MRVKFKINNRCTNKCSFCMFHNDPHLLEVKDIKHFFNLFGERHLDGVYINGGEPTIHPRFIDICAYLKENYKNKIHLRLGTNLVPFSWSQGRYYGLRDTIYETFDAINVGCDDEHRNIGVLERFAPEIAAAGISLLINVMRDYCSDETKKRILTVSDQYGAMVNFSDVHHFYKSRPVINDMSKPCQKRLKDFLIYCNGDVFFCWRQEFEIPLFNIFTVTEKEFEYYLKEYDPYAYRFCSHCSSYSPDETFDRK